MACRFDKLKAKLAREAGVTDPAGLAAYIGRKKYGVKGFDSLAANGHTRHPTNGRFVKGG